MRHLQLRRIAMVGSFGWMISGLTSCSVTNHITLDERLPGFTYADPVIYVPDKKNCDKYIPPEIMDAPAIPIEKISKLQASDKTQTIDILVEHIRTLKKHMALEHAQANRSYADYLKTCK